MPVQQGRGFVFRCAGIFESVLFQAFIIQGEAVALPKEQLETVPPAVQKYKYISGSRIKAEIITHQSAQAVEAFSHVAGMTIKKITMLWTKIEQGGSAWIVRTPEEGC